jgi:hypothetical protein
VLNFLVRYKLMSSKICMVDCWCYLFGNAQVRVYYKRIYKANISLSVYIYVHSNILDFNDSNIVIMKNTIDFINYWKLFLTCISATLVDKYNSTCWDLIKKLFLLILVFRSFFFKRRSLSKTLLRLFLSNKSERKMPMIYV